MVHPRKVHAACIGVHSGCWGDLEKAAVGKGTRQSLRPCGIDWIIQADVCEGVLALAGADQQGTCIAWQPLLRPCWDCKTVEDQYRLCTPCESHNSVIAVLLQLQILIFLEDSLGALLSEGARDMLVVWAC